MAGGQATLQGRQFGFAPDQPRGAQHRCRHRAARRQGAGQRARAFDGFQQRQCRRRRPRADFVLEHLLAVVKGQHRGGAVAAQVVQAHDTPVGVFGQGFGLQQLLRQRAARPRCRRRLRAFRCAFQQTPHLRLAALRRAASQASSSGHSGACRSPSRPARLADRAPRRASCSVAVPLTRSAPASLRRLKSRWRKALRAASAVLPGHSRAARCSRELGPSSASQASSRASGAASGWRWLPTPMAGAPPR
jgi:hypothetical protein